MYSDQGEFLKGVVIAILASLLIVFMFKFFSDVYDECIEEGHTPGYCWTLIMG